jgi:hypothetical protein
MNASSDHQASVAPQFYSNVAAPVTDPAPKVDNEFDMREQLREFLGKEKISEMSGINNQNDPRLDEIWKLKEENAKFRAQLLEAATESERLKLKGFEDQIKKLKERHEKQASSKFENDEQVEEIEKYNPSGRPVMRNIASQSIDHGSAGARSPEFNSNTNPGSGSRNISGSASLSELRSSLSSDALSGKNVSAPVVVTASGSHSAGLEIKSTELSNELIKYISSNEIDVNTLEKIKTAGMVYKYKTVENGAVVEKQIVIQYQNLDEKVKSVLDSRIAKDIDKTQGLKRSYSYSALKIILSDSKR